jgi:hypothetical protein
MAGNEINATSQALERDELSSEELDAVSGGLQSLMRGVLANIDYTQKARGDKAEADALKTFQNALNTLP